MTWRWFFWTGLAVMVLAALVWTVLGFQLGVVSLAWSGGFAWGVALGWVRSGFHPIPQDGGSTRGGSGTIITHVLPTGGSGGTNVLPTGGGGSSGR